MPDMAFCSSHDADVDFDGYGDSFSVVSAPCSPKSTGAPTTASSGRVKRPMNPFMVWAKEERPRLSQQQPGVHNAELSRLLGERWRQMSDSEKTPYRLAAQKLADQHKRNHPDYKYRPRKKDPSVRRVRGRRIKREDISRAVRSMTREEISAYVGLVLGDDDDDEDNSSDETNETAATKPSPRQPSSTESAQVVPSLPAKLACAKCIGACVCSKSCQKKLPCKSESQSQAWKTTPSSCIMDAMMSRVDLSNVLLMQPSNPDLSDSGIGLAPAIKSENPLATPEVDLVDWLDGLCSSNDDDLVSSRWSLCSSADERFSTSLGQPSPDFTGEVRFNDWL